MNLLLVVAFVVVGLLVAGVLYEQIATARDRKRYSEPPGDLVAVNGHRLHIWVMGEADPDTPTVVLESGMSSNVLDWVRLQPLIADYAQVVAYDRAGYGWSDAGPDPRTSDVIIEELHTLLHNAEITPPFVLVGHSFGGLHVRMFAERYPDEVAGLILLDSSHPAMLAEQDTEAELKRLRNVKRLKTFGIIRLMLPRILYRVQHIKNDDERQRYLAMTLLDSDNTRREAEPLFGSEIDLADQVDVPLLIISRDTLDDVTNERKWREYQERLLELSPEARHVTTQKGSHFIQLAEPELVAQHIRIFIEDLQKNALSRPDAATREQPAQDNS